ncbi:MAG: hypothetical protein UU40_C0004G0031 [Candidatus Uhrbacteria bacterium GW2011_GWD2_41_121]|uniref:Glycerophosphoryl diester phosphodiesterase membrane domain-containing protein n=1 Tax=Candidatus Uhrbacteria bacterium GW2011_GWC1_41_20 TaxID=1618983 RepID=A0A0G0XRV6_9BACT|nr:MAG: hypothetical protein UT52_C0006G0031 [Candidatus Uhrbacteria bacterium GW2011_GWE1_39_46]KKR64241.1 MAG: hypothetical protein UU04_C0004G0031 [Candidatus Uhrbacteria bacterium GW2011_GWC2_40_450]KKR88209.1 MAG: hypothetical protein UU36_C0052G0008 [Candidatus Uhrbacteria bacterium GW2011_GWE2_41_1153]KKR90374.1 MAG: hypothetical protein UU40_C0004G0031 [Candidatus Uhrbacteria bacterium GW2011_GWD2_41_121]KKR96277.1 MAG: hypothetical protein UU46_C0005G0031 [Candidatus Uhrbacteria bacter
MANLISLGEVIDKSWDHYIDHFKQLMVISLWALIIPILMIVRILLAPDGELPTLAAILESGGDILSWSGVIFGTLVSLIAVPVITIWIYINLVKAVEGQSKNKTLDLKALRAFSWRNFFSYIWVGLIKAVVTALPVLALIPGVIAIYFNISTDGGVFFGVASTLLMLAGVIIAFVLMVMFSIQLGFAGFERLLGDKRGFKAISGSRALIEGRFWQTLFRVIVAKFVFLLVIMVLEFIVMFVLSVGSMITLISGTATVGAIFGMLNLLLLSGVGILSTPIFIIVDYVIYDSLLKTR